MVAYILQALEVMQPHTVIGVIIARRKGQLDCVGPGAQTLPWLVSIAKISTKEKDTPLDGCTSCSLDWRFRTVFGG